MYKYHEITQTGQLTLEEPEMRANISIYKYQDVIKDSNALKIKVAKLTEQFTDLQGKNVRV